MHLPAALSWAVLLGALFAGCATDGGRDQVLAERPVWEPGYSWHWVSSYGANGRQPINLTLLRSITLDQMQPTADGALLKEPRTGWLGSLRRDPIGWTPQLYDPTHLGQQHIFAGSERDSGCVRYTLAGYPSPPFLQFPLTKGKKWNGTERMFESLDTESGTFHLEAQVIGREPITVQGVHYADAVRIELRYKVTAEKKADYVSPADHALTTEPTVIHYSPEARHLVKAVYPVNKISLLGPGARFPGTMWDLEAKPSSLELVSADLTAKPPTDIYSETEHFTHYNAEACRDWADSPWA